MGLTQRRIKKDVRIALRALMFCFSVFMLCSCSRGPCYSYLHHRFVKKEMIRQVPKPLPNDQRRMFDLCVLEHHHVQIIRMGQTYRFIFPSDELFDNDTPEINDRYKPILSVAADFMKTYPKIAVKVEGFSNRPHDEFITKDGGYTAELTRLQAEEVARFLTDAHINSRLIYSVGKGGLRPVAWEGTTKGHELNRRIELTFRYYENSTAWY